MTDTADAWLLDLADGRRVALGVAELEHLVAEPPPTFRIPGTRAPCTEVFLWQGRPVPLADLAAASPQENQTGLAAVVAFDGGPEAETGYGAIKISAVPRRCTVRQDEAVGPELVPADVRHFSHSAFRDTQGIVPILDLQALFLRPPPCPS